MALLVIGVGAGNLCASTVSLDTIYLNTAGGQGTPSGITVSSFVYVAAGSSLTLQGAADYITTSSSITASAFFGDGSRLMGISPGAIPLSSTRTFSGAVTFRSSFTVQTNSRSIIFSTSVAVNNIYISSSGVLSFFPALHNSSSTTIPQYSNSNTSFGPCVDGSTLTITTTGGRVELFFAGNLSSGNQSIMLNFLQDGRYVNNLSSTNGIDTLADDDIFVVPLFYLLDAPTPGQHSYCLMIAQTGSVPASSYTLYNDNFRTNTFYIEEIK